MKRIAFVMAVLALGACSKGEKAASTPKADSSSSMMMSDSTHGMMMGDTTKPK
jgi:hypothetical protein